MSVRLGIVMDPIAGISYKKDSSLAMLLADHAATLADPPAIQVFA